MKTKKQKTNEKQNKKSRNIIRGKETLQYGGEIHEEDRKGEGGVRKSKRRAVEGGERVNLGQKWRGGQF